MSGPPVIITPATNKKKKKRVDEKEENGNTFHICGSPLSPITNQKGGGYFLKFLKLITLYMEFLFFSNEYFIFP